MPPSRPAKGQTGQTSYRTFHKISTALGAILSDP